MESADFDYTLDKEARTLLIIDRKLGGPTVKAEIKNVLSDISIWSGQNISGFAVVYQGVDGLWDGVRLDRKGAYMGFVEIRATDACSALKTVPNRRKTTLLKLISGYGSWSKYICRKMSRKQSHH